jgi:gliding motility-associated-like protein
MSRKYKEIIKNHLTCLCILISISNVTAQSFLKAIYPDLPIDNQTSSDWFGGIATLITPDNGIIHIGNSQIEGYISKLDANGATVWGKRMRAPAGVEEPQSRLSIQYGSVSDDGSLILSISTNIDDEWASLVAKLDAQGNLQWMTQLPDDFSFYPFVSEIADGYIVTGAQFGALGQGDQIAYLYLDNQGQIETGKYFEYPQWFESPLWSLDKSMVVDSILYLHNVAIEPSTGPNPGNSTIILSRYNIYTEELSHLLHTIPPLPTPIGGFDYFSIYNMEVDDDGSFYLNTFDGDDQLLSKYSSDGAPLWSLNINMVGEISLTDSDVIISGYYRPYLTTATFYLDKVTGDWKKSFFYNDMAFGFDIGSSKEGALAFTGATPPDLLASLGFQSFPSIIVKTDPEGLINSCQAFEACEFEIPSAEILPYSPLGSPSVLTIDPFTTEAADILITDQAFVNEPYCIPYTFDAGFITSNPFCPLDSVATYSDIEHFLPTTSVWNAEEAIFPISIQDTAIFQFENSGLFEVEHILDMLGCEVTASEPIEVLEGPVFDLGADTTRLCLGDSVRIESGLLPSEASFIWQDGSTEEGIWGKEYGWYKLTATSSFGCTSTDSINIAPASSPVFTLGSDIVICKDEEITISPDMSPGAAQYQWNIGETGESITTAEAGIYILSLTDALTNCTTMDSIEVSISLIPPFTYRLSEELFCPGRPPIISAETINNAPLTFIWPDGSTGEEFKTPTAGTYTLLATDGFCTDSLIIDIPAGSCLTNIYIPNAFSPNDDGRNDLFQVFGPEIEVRQLSIFNRWGSLVYEGDGSDAYWDGQINGQRANTGVYIYQLEYLNTLSLKLEKASGSVILVR